MLTLIAWWATIQLFGLAALPLTRRVFACLPDRGYAFSKVVGLLLVSYLLWLGAITGILPNNNTGILLALLLVAALSSLPTMLNAIQRRSILPSLRIDASRIPQILVTELLFLLTFASWALVRAYAPDKIMPFYGEKYMEIGFLNGVLNSPRFPPLDPWMAGLSISYYYFGYVMMAVMTRFSGSAPTIGFDLYDALTFALTAVAAYGLVSNLIAASGGSRRAASGFGLLGALFAGGMGNLEGLLEGLYSARLLPASFWKWIDIPGLVGSEQSGALYPGSDWWWWRASRVLHDLDLFHKPVVYQPIDEFPFFSFLLGDNHPHKMALPFVLLVIGLAFNLMLWEKNRPFVGSPERWHGRQFANPTVSVFLFCALALGGLAFLNTWDFPIYLGLVLLAYALGRLLSRLRSRVGQRIGPRLIGRLLALGAGLGAGAVLLYIFFYTNFASQAGGVLPYVFAPTRLSQYLVMFGPFIFILACFAVGAVRRATAGRFPLRQALVTWAWIAGLSYAAFLAALGLGLAIVLRSGEESSAFLHFWMGDLTPSQALRQVLLARITNPWLFLLLSTLLALIITAVLRALAPASRQGLPSENTVPAPSETPAGDPAGDPADAAATAADAQPITALPPPTLFALLVAFTGLALTLVVEFFYLRDAFGLRMNTVFKFYYQGWVMMAIASAYGAWWVGRFAAKAARWLFWPAAVLLVSGGLVYTCMGIYSRADAFSYPPNFDAAATFQGKYPGDWIADLAAHPDDWAAIQWLLNNGRLPGASNPNILEAGSGGYENAGRISAFTGFPTILGWTNHESQWRGNYVEINRRTPIIQTIYTTPSGSTALDLLRQWKVTYVIVGDAEREYVNKLCTDPQKSCNANAALAKFPKILKPVFTQGGTTVYQMPATP